MYKSHLNLITFFFPLTSSNHIYMTHNEKACNINSMSGHNNTYARSVNAYQPTMIAILNSRGQAQATANPIQPTRVAVPNSVQPTLIAGERQIATGRNQPHITIYTMFHTTYDVCRCSNPRSHGDAYSVSMSSERYEGIPRLSLNNNRLSWEEQMHRSLDSLNRDRASRAEIRSVWHLVFYAETVQQLQQKERNCEWSERRGTLRHGVPHDAICHTRGMRNPRRCIVLPKPGAERRMGVTFIGVQGGWRLVEDRPEEGRPTMAGRTWGASQYNLSGSSTRGRR